MEIKTKSNMDVRATLNTFEVGEGRFVPYSESNMETTTIRSRYHKLKKEGLVVGEFRFTQETARGIGTIITRIA